jgi:hypothetical protein
MISLRRPLGRDGNDGEFAVAEGALSRKLRTVQLARTAKNPMILGSIAVFGYTKLARIPIPDS